MDPQVSTKRTPLSALYNTETPPAGLDLLGLIGYPLDNSPSDTIHNTYCQTVGMPALYGKTHLSANDLGNFLNQSKAVGIKGLSITMPLKEAILPYLDTLSPEAEAIGAVNTVLFQDSKIIGHNTDGVGAIRAIEQALGEPVSNKRIVIVGAGGAAKAIAWEATQQKAQVFILNRTKEKARLLAEKVGASYDSLIKASAVLNEGCDVLIQTTPIGMLSNHSLIPPVILKPTMLVFDIITKPATTELLKGAQKQGCKVLHGQEMWIHQALEQYKLWLGESAIIDESTLRTAVKQSA